MKAIFIIFLTIFFFFFMLLSITSFSSSINLFNGAFVEYKVYYINYQSNSSILSLEIENITQIFSNSTFKYVVWYINLNESYYYPPGVNYDSLYYPKNFFYIPDVGNSSLNRAIKLVLSEEINGTYVYRGQQCLVYGNYINWTIYVNNSGVPSKIFLYQFIGGKLVSNTTYVLLRSNILNHNVTIYFPSNVTLRIGKAVPLVAGNIVFSTIVGKIESIIIGIATIVIIFILLFRKTNFIK